jgi:hypothetical protein
VLVRFPPPVFRFSQDRAAFVDGSSGPRHSLRPGSSICRLTQIVWQHRILRRGSGSARSGGGDASSIPVRKVIACGRVLTVPNTSTPIPWEEALEAQGRADMIAAVEKQDELERYLDTVFRV